MNKRISSWVKLNRQTILIWLVGAFGYFIFAQLGLTLATINSAASPVWPAAGFAAALMWRFGRQSLVGIGLGSFIANMLTGSVAVGFFISWGAVAEAFIFLLVLERFFPMQKSKLKSKNCDKLEVFPLILVSVLAPISSALMGSGTLWLAGIVPFSGISDNFLTWWIGDALGLFIFYPIITSIFGLDLKVNRKPVRPMLLDLFRTALLFGIVGAISYFVFVGAGYQGSIFVLFPLLVLGRYLSPKSETCATTLIIVSVAIWSTVRGHGPFAWGTVNESLIALQIFLAAIGLTSMVLGALQIQSLRKPAVLTVLFVGWVAAGMTFYISYEAQDVDDNEHLKEIAYDAQTAVKSQLKHYDSLLRGGVAAFLLKPQMTREDWRKYTARLNVVNGHSGIRGLGFVAKVKNENLMAFEKEQRKNGNLDFSVHGFKGNSNKYDVLLETIEDRGGYSYPVTYIEPLEPNRALLGLDLASEKNRKESADLAAATGDVAITKQIHLLNDVLRRPASLFFLPVMQTTEQGVKEHLGWVYAPIVIGSSFVGRGEAIFNEVSISISSNEDFAAEHMLFGPAAEVADVKTNAVIKSISVGNIQFFLRVVRGPGFVSQHNFMVPLIGLFGALVTLLIAWMYTNVLSYQMAAEMMLFQKTKSLVAQNNLWQVLMNTAPVGIFMADSAGSLTYVNPAYERIHGYTLAEVGLKRKASIHMEDNAGFEAEWNECIQKGRYFDRVFRVVRQGHEKPSEVRHVHSIASKIHSREANTEYGWVGVDIDITEVFLANEFAEKQRINAENATRLASLGEMASGIAHEINNPLTIIAGKARKIRKFVSAASDNEEALEALASIDKTVKRATKIINGLRTFSRESSRDLPMVSSLKLIIEESLELCAQKLKDHSIDLKVNIEGDDQILCKASQLSQVFLNLINNAHDAVVGTKSPWVLVESRRLESVIEISVTDSGEGISAAIREKIMQPFFTTKAVGKGTGLGLSISRGIIENHGGRFFVDEACFNTRFVIHLPIAEAKKSAA